MAFVYIPPNIAVKRKISLPLRNFPIAKKCFWILSKNLCDNSAQFDHWSFEFLLQTCLLDVLKTGLIHLRPWDR